MFELSYNQQLRICRFGENEYQLVIADIREDGSIKSVKETGLFCEGVTKREAELAAEDIMLAFTKPSIGSRWVK